MQKLRYESHIESVLDHVSSKGLMHTLRALTPRPYFDTPLRLHDQHARIMQYMIQSIILSGYYLASVMIFRPASAELISIFQSVNITRYAKNRPSSLVHTSIIYVHPFKRHTHLTSAAYYSQPSHAQSAPLSALTTPASLRNSTIIDAFLAAWILPTKQPQPSIFSL